MAWRLIEVPDDNLQENDLTNSELIGVSILVGHSMGEPYDSFNVYYRAWQKMQESVETAISKDKD